jgi:hypothetical protein
VDDMNQWRLRDPAARRFHGYDGDAPVHLVVRPNGESLHVDRFAGDDSYFLAVASGFDDAARLEVTRAQLLALARDIISKLEG